ncbi:xanthine dehydrogenase family protein subunit M [Lentzea sp. NPDC034063]|uniref:FAD binding domain-containing protein n=1 Tax=unclassified Lentzea TaxID=2643253 RepID=UPI0033E7FA69
MKEFAYRRATAVHEALTSVAEADTKFLAGGTNLVDLMKRGVETPARLVDVRALPLNGISEASNGDLVIGATTTNSETAAHPEIRRRYPALAQAVLAGASGQLRNMATTAGNLLQRTRCAYFADLASACNKRVPGSGCAALEGEHHNHAVLGTSPSCVATNPSDMAVALMLFDAVVRYETLTGTGEIPIARFFQPVGDTPHVETTLPAGALITSVTLPHREGGRSRYRKVRERASYAFANVSVAADLSVELGRVREVRIALGGVASHPWRAQIAEERLLGGPATPEMFRAAAEAELAAATPLPHNGYKVPLARNLVQAVLTDLTRAE